MPSCIFFVNIDLSCIWQTLFNGSMNVLIQAQFTTYYHSHRLSFWIFVCFQSKWMKVQCTFALSEIIATVWGFCLFLFCLLYVEWGSMGNEISQTNKSKNTWRIQAPNHSLATQGNKQNLIQGRRVNCEQDTFRINKVRPQLVPGEYRWQLWNVTIKDLNLNAENSCSL